MENSTKKEINPEQNQGQDDKKDTMNQVQEQLQWQEEESKSRFEVRCHEWGDGSDYNWCYCDTKEKAIATVKHFYAKDPLNIYEHLYILETKANGTREVVSIDD